MISNLSATSKIKVSNLDLDKNDTYFKLEDLEVTPSAEEQIFKSSKYGYNEVTVKAVETEELNATSSLENQEYEGLFGKVNIAGIEAEETTITPTTETQVNEGLYSKVTVSGDENLIADNIKQGITIFGVEGNMAGAWDTTQIRSCQNMFYNNKEIIDAPYFDTSNVKTMTHMFEDCENLKTVPTYNLSSATHTNAMFRSCTDLETIGNFDTSNVVNMERMFSNCRSEKLVIPLLNCEKVYDISNVLSMTYDIQDILGFKDLGKGYYLKSNNHSYHKLDLSDCRNLTHDSLMNIINNLYDLNLTYDVANGGTLYTQQLVLGSENMAKLTAEEIAIATNKGWVVS